MDPREAFGTFHPLVTFVFFIVAIVFGMVVREPAFLAVGLIASGLSYLTLRGRAAWPVFGGMAIVFLGIALVNPLFNTLGSTVLFTYLDGRPYTFEALAYGMAMGAALVTMLLWFFSYNIVMTTDKFTYLFGSTAPSLSMVLTMVLRFVPLYQAKIAQFATARASIGKAVGEGGLRDRIGSGLALISILTTWAFENAIVTADSMRSRGYGVGRRTSFALYRFTLRDAIALGLIIGFAGVAAFCAMSGAAAVEYTPAIVLPAHDARFWVGICAYAALLLIPVIIDGWEVVSWSILRSGI